MPFMEENLRKILNGNKSPFGDKIKILSSPRAHELHRMYKALGGRLDDFPTRVGKWDIYLDQPTAEKNLGFGREVVIELDEELHFNRYRNDTLKAPFYSELNNYFRIDYPQYCEGHENAALRRGSHGRFWTTKSAEKQFGQAGHLGILEGNGAPRWKQRAFYDMLKDLASLILNIPLARISVWDEVHLEEGTTDDVRSILKREQISSPKVEALKKLIGSRVREDLP